MTENYATTLMDDMSDKMVTDITDTIARNATVFGAISDYPPLCNFCFRGSRNHARRRRLRGSKNVSRE